MYKIYSNILVFSVVLVNAGGKSSKNTTVHDLYNSVSTSSSVSSVRTSLSEQLSGTQPPIIQTTNVARTEFIRIIKNFLERGQSNKLLTRLKALLGKGLIARESLDQALLLVASDNTKRFDLSDLAKVLIAHGADVTCFNGKLLYYSVKNKYMWLFDILLAASHSHKNPFRYAHFYECYSLFSQDALNNWHNSIALCFGACINTKIHHYDPYYFEEIVFEQIAILVQVQPQECVLPRLQALAIELMPDCFVINDEFIQIVQSRLLDGCRLDDIIGAIVEVRKQILQPEQSTESSEN